MIKEELSRLVCNVSLEKEYERRGRKHQSVLYLLCLDKIFFVISWLGIASESGSQCRHALSEGILSEFFFQIAFFSELLAIGNIA